MMWIIALLVPGVLAAMAAGLVFVLVATGRLTLDTGLGRRTRPLGPQVVRIRAPRETVFDLVAVPYLAKNPPRALREKVEVLDAGADLVLAAHRTKAGGLTAVTVETVSFDRPERIGFRLVRGPVPFVVEGFTLREVDDGVWGRIVAGHWERTVEKSLEGLKVAAEERAARSSARAGQGPEPPQSESIVNAITG